MVFGQILDGIVPNKPVIKQLYGALVQRQQKEQQVVKNNTSSPKSIK